MHSIPSLSEKLPESCFFVLSSITFLDLLAWKCLLLSIVSSLSMLRTSISFICTSISCLVSRKADRAYSSYMVASAGGMFLGGFIATRARFPERIIAIGFILGSSISVLIAMTVVSGSTMMSLFIVMGFCVGITGPSRDLMIRSATPKEASGRVFGTVYSGLDSGLAIGPLIFGLLMDWKMAPGVFILIAAFLMTALITAFRVGENNRFVGLKSA